MNEFEWRRQMRDLRQPVTPRRDIWASIDAALADAEPARVAATPLPDAHILRAQRRWMVRTAVAASLLLASALAWHLRPMPAAAPLASAPSRAAKWKPADPRLAGAAIELDAARMELQQAIQQAPDSPALQRILARTETQQTQLRQLAREAG